METLVVNGSILWGDLNFLALESLGALENLTAWQRGKARAAPKDRCWTDIAI